MEENSLNKYFFCMGFSLVILFSFTLFSKTLKGSWKNLSGEEKKIVLKNYFRWKKFNDIRKDEWRKNRKRFKNYSKTDKDFLRNIYLSYYKLPNTKKKQWLDACRIFKSLPKKIQKDISIESIFIEAFVFRRKSLPNHKEIDYFKNNFSSHYHSLIELRKSIFKRFRTLEKLRDFPFHLQQNIMQLPKKYRIKLFTEAEKKNGKEGCHFLLGIAKYICKQKKILVPLPK